LDASAPAFGGDKLHAMKEDSLYGEHEFRSVAIGAASGFSLRETLPVSRSSKREAFNIQSFA